MILLLRKWRVDSVFDMYGMFDGATAFNRDLSSWVVSSVTNMDKMFIRATAYTQTLCGNTWIDSGADKLQMFVDTGSNAIN